MPDRSAPIVVTPRACPFVALDGDRDRRLDAPDPLHRCFAEQIPRARSISHQADYCLSPAFPTCPIFQDWASRAAAAPVQPRLPVAAVPQRPAERSGDATHEVTTATRSGALPARDVSPEDDPDGVRLAAVARATDHQADDDVTATRPVPSYRAVSPTGTVPVSRATTTPGLDRTLPVPGSVVDPDPGAPDEIPVIRSIPTPRSGPAAHPATDEDWMSPPPWLRQPTEPVWVPEAVPPPDALADVGTQSVRRPRSDVRPVVIAEASAPTGVEPGYGMPGGQFSDDTTGMPPESMSDAAAGTSARAVAPIAGAASPGPTARIVEATGTGTQPLDPGVEAELAASRYRADVAVGLEPDEDTGAAPGPRAGSRQRRVPVDVQAAWLGSQAQARPTARATGSREWEGPRRFEAYAATQRRRPPTSVLVGGGAIALVVVLLGVFLLPGMLMGGAPASTATPAPTELTAGVGATDAPPSATSAPDGTERPDTTPKPKTYTVKSGDTLIKIAKRFKTNVAKLTCLNKIRNPNNVAVGRTLTIPPKGYRCPRD